MLVYRQPPESSNEGIVTDAGVPGAPASRTSFVAPTRTGASGAFN
jgi:hypothetical protein